MAKNKRFAPPTTGGISLLAVFAVLCLTVFALLSISTVQANKRLSEASAKSVAAYYEADYKAQKIFARIRAGEVPEGVTTVGGQYTYQCPVSDSQAIEVAVSRTDGQWRILRWELIQTKEWNTNESLNVWDGKSGTREP